MSLAQSQAPAANNSTAKSGYSNSKAEEYARWRRRDHANIEAMQNLAVSAIAQETEIEMPPNVRHLISALQGAHGGGEVAYEPFERDYLTVGRQLQFTGTQDAVRSRVRDWINALDAWQRAAGFELFSVVKGGEIIGQRPDGTPIRQKTRFIDNLKPKADEAVQRARQSETWRGDRQKGIKAHPGRALEEQVGWLVAELPRIKPADEDGEGKEPKAPEPVAEFERRRESSLLRTLEQTADEIEERNGDADLWLEKIELKVRKMRESRLKTNGARRSWITLHDDEVDEQAEVVTPLAGATTAYKGDFFEPVPAAEPGSLRKEIPTQAAPEPQSPQEFSEPDSAEPAPSMLEWAQTWAAEDVAVFPLYGVADGVCDCREGSECRSAGKHPLARLAPNGVKDATTDPEQIQRWWTAAPLANIGIAMGGRLRLLGVDVDPRSGGDASLSDLTEAHGPEWLETFTVRTGSLGYHFLYRLPESVEVHRGKLAPGIDLKAEGGYLVAAPSMHASGRRYDVEKSAYVATAPAWLLEEIIRPPSQPSARVINFQDKRPQLGTTGEVFCEGERNAGLFAVGIGRWRHGWAADVAELHAQLLEVNAARCSPPLDDAEVAKMVANISARYGYLRGIDAQQK
jgi:hypothetical protein